MSVNGLFAVGHLLVGFRQSSWWFLTVGAYYLILMLMRLFVLLSRNRRAALIAPRIVGGMLMATALPLLGTVILCAVIDVGTEHHEIIMIAIALYAFVKITLAIFHQIRARKRSSQTERILRSISLADAAVSIASLQRSMLVSFEGMSGGEIKIFNVATGTVACLFVFAIGWLLIRTPPYHNKKSTEVKI